MSQAGSLRQQVREEIERAAGPVLMIRGEADLQALNALVRALGSNPLLASHLGSGAGALQIQVMPGNYEGCACRAESDSDTASAVRPAASRGNMVPAFAGLITLARIQAANLPKGSTILLDQDAVITPQVRDWLRQNKTQVQRSES